jgi:hypothetical protein
MAGWAAGCGSRRRCSGRSFVRPWLRLDTALSAPHQDAGSPALVWTSLGVRQKSSVSPVSPCRMAHTGQARAAENNAEAQNQCNSTIRNLPLRTRPSVSRQTNPTRLNGNAERQTERPFYYGAELHLMSSTEARGQQPCRSPEEDHAEHQAREDDHPGIVCRWTGLDWLTTINSAATHKYRRTRGDARIPGVPNRAGQGACHPTADTGCPANTSRDGHSSLTRRRAAGLRTDRSFGVGRTSCPGTGLAFRAEGSAPGSGRLRRCSPRNGGSQRHRD